MPMLIKNVLSQVIPEVSESIYSEYSFISLF